MANLFIQDPIYITVDELKESTVISALVTESDDNIKKLITESQLIIDQYIGTYPTKVLETQEFIFPTVEDDIPLNIKKATVLLSESLYSGGYLSGTGYESSSGNVLSEKYGAHSVVYSSSTGSEINSYDKYINEQIYRLLQPYINKGFQEISGNTWFAS